jgi:hypothetical protein
MRCSSSRMRSANVSSVSSSCTGTDACSTIGPCRRPRRPGAPCTRSPSRRPAALGVEHAALETTARATGECSRRASRRRPALPRDDAHESGQADCLDLKGGERLQNDWMPSGDQGPRGVPGEINSAGTPNARAFSNAGAPGRSLKRTAIRAGYPGRGLRGRVRRSCCLAPTPILPPASGRPPWRALSVGQTALSSKDSLLPSRNEQMGPSSSSPRAQES